MEARKIVDHEESVVGRSADGVARQVDISDASLGAKHSSELSLEAKSVGAQIDGLEGLEALESAQVVNLRILEGQSGRCLGVNGLKQGV